MNFYSPTQEDIKRKRDEEDAHIVWLVKKHKESWAEVIFKPLIQEIVKGLVWIALSAIIFLYFPSILSTISLIK